MMLYLTIGILVVAGVLHAVQQVASHRPDRTWLPRWFQRMDHPINLDGFHIVKAVSRWLLFAAGMTFQAYLTDAVIEPSTIIGSAWLIVLFWFIEGETMDLCYHTLLMKREWVECGICIRVLGFLRLIKGKR